MSLFTLLGTTSWDVVSKHLKEQYIENSDEIARRAHHRLLDDFYEGKGDLEIARLIDIAFKDPATREMRKDLIAWSKWINLIKRIVCEVATVYSEPAARKITEGDETYQRFLDIVQLDDTMREVDRQLELHEDVLVMYRVRETPRGREPVVDVVSPASFWAIAHPNDRTMLIGVIIDQRTSLAQRKSERAFRVWTDDETFMLDGECRFMKETLEPWPLGRLPGVLATTRRPGSKSRLLAECPSSDLLAAQSAVWLENLLLLKESKSANRQTFVTGDTDRATMGQSADTEREVFLPEGVQVQPIDRGMDLGQFRDNSRFISDGAGSNRGVPPSVMRQEGATSGTELHLRRAPLRELRRLRIPVMRWIELALARVMSLVNSARPGTLPDDHGNPIAVIVSGDLQDFAFSAEGFSIDFGEVQAPLTEQERDAVYDERRRLLLTDGVAEERARNPDIKTDEEAFAVIEERVKRQTRITALTKEQQALNGSAGSAVGERTAEENGAMGHAAANDKPNPFAKH